MTSLNDASTCGQLWWMRLVHRTIPHARKKLRPHVSAAFFVIGALLVFYR